MKTPLGPEDMVEALRERIKKEDLTLTASEAGRIIWLLERLSQRCAEAYQVVGSLAGLAEVMDDPAVQKALDLFSVPTRPGDVLPFVTQKERQCKITKTRTKAKSSPKTTSRKVRRKSRS
jgi:predicted nucleotidyltransferase